MFKEYLLTGATGFLGNTIAWKLHEKGCRCKALVRSGDAFSNKLPPDTELYNGDLLDYDSLEDFFSGSSEESCIIHCAGIVSIASKHDERIHKVNVKGTWNVLRSIAEHYVGRMIYVSSIHAIPEKPTGNVHTELSSFDANRVKGEYI